MCEDYRNARRPAGFLGPSDSGGQAGASRAERRCSCRPVRAHSFSPQATRPAKRATENLNLNLNRELGMADAPSEGHLGDVLRSAMRRSLGAGTPSRQSTRLDWSLIPSDSHSLFLIQIQIQIAAEALNLSVSRQPPGLGPRTRATSAPCRPRSARSSSPRRRAGAPPSRAAWRRP